MEAVYGEGGGDAVAGDVDDHDAEGVVLRVGVDVEVREWVCEEEVAADLSHGFVAVVEADWSCGDGRREEGFVDAPGVGEFAFDLAVTAAEGAKVKALFEAAVSPPCECDAREADEW
jgi:hypothetical protein